MTGHGAGREHPSSVTTGRPSLLVLASTVPAERGDGTPGFVEDLARALADRFDVTVLAPRVTGAPARRPFPGGQVVRFGYLPRRWEHLADGAILENLRAHPLRWAQVPALVLAESVATWRWLRRTEPVAVHAHWLVPQGLVAVLAARGTPVVVTAHGGDVYGLPGRAARAVQSFVVRRAAWVTTANEDLRERLVALGADPDRTSVLPMGVDLDEVVQAASAGPGLPGRLVVVGRLVEKKGVHVLLAALRASPPDGPWSLDVVGDGPWRGRLEQLAEGMPVRFLGTLDHAATLDSVGAASVVVVPSVAAATGDRDGLPVALLEAMAAGRAVVASRLPGVGDLIRSGHDGVLVEPGDEAALATAIRDLLADPQRCGRLGAAAALTAAGHGVAAVAAGYAAVLDAVVPDAVVPDAVTGTHA